MTKVGIELLGQLKIKSDITMATDKHMEKATQTPMVLYQYHVLQQCDTNKKINKNPNTKCHKNKEIKTDRIGRTE